MTCIAWDGKTLAADKLSCWDGLKSTTTKIHRIGNVLIGTAGDSDFCRSMIEWVRGGRVIGDFPEHQKTMDTCVTLLVIESDGAILQYERTPYPIKYEQKVFAIGSGREYARAAMHLGCTAAEAIAVAIELDCNCGNGIDALELEK